MITLRQTKERRHKRRDALEDLGRLLNERRSILVVHYSCESFYDRPDGSSPRITSIAVRNFATGQTVSFSIHQMAERKRIEPSAISAQYDELERQMLDEFAEYGKQHRDKWWVHWNMRDANYGFAAIAHRSRVLNVEPSHPADDRPFDLARTLVSLYGVQYAPHPRLKNIIEINKISALDMLDGQQEADAFDNGDYVKLHLSTLRKVDVIANILGRVSDGTLKTNAPATDQYGSWLGAAAAFLQEHPLAIVILAAIGIIGFLTTVIGWII